MVQILPIADRHVARQANQCGIIDTHYIDRLKAPIDGTDHGTASQHGRSVGDPGDSTDFAERCRGHANIGINRPGGRIHDPDIGSRDIFNSNAAAHQQIDENRQLLADQQG